VTSTLKLTQEAIERAKSASFERGNEPAQLVMHPDTYTEFTKMVHANLCPANKSPIRYISGLFIASDEMMPIATAAVMDRDGNLLQVISDLFAGPIAKEAAQ
jgi:hypothetical protein